MENKKILLWNVDVQHDFMDRNGALYVDNAESIKENLFTINQYAKENEISIVTTCDWHNMNSAEFSEYPDFKETFPPHCVANTYGADIIQEVKPEKYDMIIEWTYPVGNRFVPSKVKSLPDPFHILIKKDKFDVFSGNPYTQAFVNIIKEKFDTILVTGVSGNVCVHQAVMGLLRNKFNVKVVTDCVSSLKSLPSCEPDWVKGGAELIKLSQI